MKQELITFDEKNKVFHLHNDQISYLLSVEDDGALLFVLGEGEGLELVVRHASDDGIVVLGGVDGG